MASLAGGDAERDTPAQHQERETKGRLEREEGVPSLWIFLSLQFFTDPPLSDLFALLMVFLVWRGLLSHNLGMRIIVLEWWYPLDIKVVFP